MGARGVERRVKDVERGGEREQATARETARERERESQVVRDIGGGEAGVERGAKDSESGSNGL